MNVVGISATKSDVKEENGTAHTIQTYEEAPTVELSLDDFEIYALKRLKVLRKLERIQSSRTAQTDGAKSKSALQTIISEELHDPEVDKISHFILKAAYSLDEEKRRWFLNHETALFRHKLESVAPKQLMKSCKQFQLKPLSAREHQEKIQLLRLLLPSNNNNNNATNSGFTSRASGKDPVFYKVPFTQALDLVAKRQCVVERGFAYIPSTKVISILAGKFRMKLSASLAQLAQNGLFQGSTGSSEVERLHPLLKNLNSCLVENEPSDELSGFQSSQVNPSNIPKLTKHMPLCMRSMQNGLKQDKKLRYHGRLQYGLFLKGAGLSLEDAMTFFQRSFSNMTPEAFQKEYAYNIRHVYGKEGQKKSKSAYNCQGIINSQAPSNSGDHHGCPYKNYDADKLSKILQSMKIGTPNDRSAIVNLQKSKHYNLACLEHFKVMHKNAETMEDISVENVGNHPNAWFRASMAYAESKNGGVTDDAVTPTAITSSSEPEPTTTAAAVSPIASAPDVTMSN